MVGLEVGDSERPARELGRGLSVISYPLSVIARRLEQKVLLHFAQRGDAFSVLLHRADGNTDPFGQVIAFHGSDDDFALEQRAKNRKAVADIHENEICRAGYKPKSHRSNFFFQIGAPLVGQLFRFALMLFIRQRR